MTRKLLVEFEAQASRQGDARIYLTTGFRQPEAKHLYLTNGYTALFSVADDLEALRHLPFEKRLALARPRLAEAAE